ncbi:hypothetical protein H2199_000104 [Coniosporium tulheliwenetii]|uniref:Uncharacterized protein n=1 Tax=Coniosporium tulheliwenetii TaxID=3383036 RepID=A0ACC2ZPK7_9PEZI|nr:hypothetical protein H2199_000104 [Cladosporium sp. JES 115]
MSAETLSSNVVNYLIWRYLQEAGFASTAQSLMNDWNRDPQSLPFANNVHQHALVHIIQDGLLYDRLQAEVSQGGRNYDYGTSHGTPYVVHNNKRRRVSDQRTSLRPETNGDFELNDAMPARGAPKRTRESNGAESTRERSNEDAMDIDMNGMVQTPNGDADVAVSEADSPIVEEVPIETTLDNGVSVGLQSEKIAELAPETTFIKLDEPEVTLRHTVWSPTEAPIFCAAGDSLLTVYCMVKDTRYFKDSQDYIPRKIDLPFLKYTITAFCWISPTEAFAAALEDHTNEKGETRSTGRLLALREGGVEVQILSSLVGTVFALRWRASAQRLLSISSSDRGGSIRIWSPNNPDPLHTFYTGRVILDAAWCSDDRFLVGGHGFLTSYTLDHAPSSSSVTEAISGDRAQDFHWEKVRYDPICDIVACASLEQNEIGLYSKNSIDFTTLSVAENPITALEFQPIINPLSHLDESPRLLATAHDTGLVQIWDAKRPWQLLHRLSMGGAPAMALSFSPDGFLLAAAGLATVLIWNPEVGGLPKAFWKADFEKDPWDTSIGADREEELDHTLGWDADGKKLAFSLANQIAIISFKR